MYKIIFTNNRLNYKKPIIEKGDFPYNLAEDLFIKQNLDFVIISTRSNTIKVPYLRENWSGRTLDFKEFCFSDAPTKEGNPFVDYFLSL